LHLDAARAHVDRQEWLKAAESYTRFSNIAGSNGEAWFEYAAARLLTGDQDGYRQTCQAMVEANQKNRVALRSYLVARACTLASDSVPDMALVPVDEVKRASGQFWSLTEQGALHYRTGRYKEAIEAFERSLRLERSLGASVLNWLWLALAHHQLGENDERQARYWLNRAVTWLDGIGNQMPNKADAISLHRHNWLEAHILRREAEALLATKPSTPAPDEPATGEP